MDAPLIGLTTYGRDGQGWFQLPGEYVDSVRRAGGVPLLIPPGEPDVGRWVRTVDALVLTGGGDLDPDVYGGARLESTYMVDGERDRSELALARRLLDSDLPGLCICRGTQVLNVALGGTLVEHVPDEFAERVTHRLPPREPTPHAVSVEPGSRLAGLLGATEIEAVSWHHQAIRDLGEGLSVVARAPDGVIEAVELAGRERLVAVQWHPELSSATDAAQQGLFDWLVREAGGSRG